MKLLASAVLLILLVGSNPQASNRSGKENGSSGGSTIAGFRDVSGEQEIEKRFLAVPDRQTGRRAPPHSDPGAAHCGIA